MQAEGLAFVGIFSGDLSPEHINQVATQYARTVGRRVRVWTEVRTSELWPK